MPLPHAATTRTRQDDDQDDAMDEDSALPPSLRGALKATIHFNRHTPILYHPKVLDQYPVG